MKYYVVPTRILTQQQAEDLFHADNHEVDDYTIQEFQVFADALEYEIICKMAGLVTKLLDENEFAVEQARLSQQSGRAFSTGRKL